MASAQNFLSWVGQRTARVMYLDGENLLDEKGHVTPYGPVMLRSRWPRSPSRETSSPTSCGLSRNCGPLPVISTA
jgi:hypothetical protein